MANDKIKITSVSELLDESDKHSSRDWIYRGVTDQRFKLLPSIGHTRHYSVKQTISESEEEQALWRFKDNVRSHIGHTVENDLEWMVIAQHHGLPTRLLDWTRRPLVAAYFAATTIQNRITLSPTRRINTPIDGAIYAVKRPPKVGLEDREKPFQVDRVKFIDPPHISERVPRQVSVLTIHPTPAEPWNPSDMIKFLIPKQYKFGIKKELDRLGINEAALFPGVDATARYIGWQLKWDRLP